MNLNSSVRSLSIHQSLIFPFFSSRPSLFFRLCPFILHVRMLIDFMQCPVLLHFRLLDVPKISSRLFAVEICHSAEWTNDNSKGWLLGHDLGYRWMDPDDLVSPICIYFLFTLICLCILSPIIYFLQPMHQISSPCSCFLPGFPISECLAGSRGLAQTRELFYQGGKL